MSAHRRPCPPLPWCILPQVVAQAQSLCVLDPQDIGVPLFVAAGQARKHSIGLVALTAVGCLQLRSGTVVRPDMTPCPLASLLRVDGQVGHGAHSASFFPFSRLFYWFFSPLSFCCYYHYSPFQCF